ncbi:MAG: heavy metal translocating P-type ATPase [Oscillospiraceae bacterium]|nr:heavy metal translocating P-type ATPase [Oscillospiraceae bacterium]
MSCAACSARVEKAVLKVEGVTSCSVSLLTNSMLVEGKAKPQEIIAAVVKAGYGAELNNNSNKENKVSDEKDNNSAKETKVLKKRFFFSLGFLLPLMYVSMGYSMWGWYLPEIMGENPFAIGLIQLILTAIIMMINQKFFISGFKGLLNKSPNMDTLVALGAGAAFVYSTFMLFAMSNTIVFGNVSQAHHYIHQFYFESSAMILTLITLGKMLEAYSKGKTTNALKGLMSLAPKTATVIRDSKELIIPLDEVVKGDIFVVKPGENIPVDGVITEGSTSINQGAITGESIPADKSEGDTVTGGTVNLSGYIKCRATKVGEDTTLSQIIKMVSDASATKAPIAKVADKVSGVFVPIVIGIAVITTFVWLLFGEGIGFALARGISVLVISCPCALGLATPVAIMVGSGIGAKQGILFKTAASLETAGKVSYVLLDKTGTITKGEPTVTDIITVEDSEENISEDDFLRIACSLEKKSEHPLSKAIIAEGNRRSLDYTPVDNFKTETGNGLKGTLDGKSLVGGSYAFISKVADVSERVKNQADSLANQGKTPLFFACDNKLLGIIAVADIVKSDSKTAVRDLRNMGITTIMLTGDNSRTANAIGEQVGVDRIIADVLPDGKEQVVKDLMKKGKVAMVGDGINDAPALTRADIGIAIGAGTDIAVDSADVVLMNNSLGDVSAAIRLSRGTLRNIHQNLFWAFIYNVIGIPLACGIWIPIFGLTLSPMFGAAAMSLSSFCVVTNALRLNFLNIKSNSKDKKIKNKNNKKEKNKMEKTLNIKGMMCPHCEMTVKKALEEIPQVETAIVSHESGTAVVTLTSDVADDVLKNVVTDKGYEVL